MNDYILKDGIYLNMPEDTYHALPFLSASACKDMYISEGQFLANFSGDVKKESDALTKGSAYHKYLLEGAEAFNKDYAVKPSGMSFATKAGKEWRENNIGKKVISSDVFDEILKRSEDLATIEHPIKNGLSEVSVIWTEMYGGVEVRCKARIDYMSPSHVFDLKTFCPIKRQPMAQYVNSLAGYDLHIMQVIFYERALRKAKDLPIFGANDNTFSIVKSVLNGYPRFGIFYVRAGDVAEYYYRFVAEKSSGIQNLYYENATNFIENCIAKFPQILQQGKKIHMQDLTDCDLPLSAIEIEMEI